MLEFDGASKRFGALVALDACSFVARPGRLTGFLGPNGAGKTTAMRAVFGLVALDERQRSAGRGRRSALSSGPGSGTCRRSAASIRACVSATSSSTWVGSAVEAPSRWTAASTCGSTGSAWQSRARDRLDALSHGNQQRVQLIAALVNEPELLVLDEPFSGLDPLAIAAMSELLAEVAGDGATVLFSSHQLDLVEDICEDVVIIDAGRIVRSGDLTELRAEVPQRFVTVRYRGAAPDWSGLGCDRARGRGRRRGAPARRAGCRPGGDGRRRSAGAPSWSRSPTSRRRCRSCSVRRWRHERRPPELAGRRARDPRAGPLPRLPRCRSC